MSEDANMISVGQNETTQETGKKRKVEKMEFNVSKHAESLWLCKVPEFLGEKLARAKHDDVIGKLRIKLKSGGPGKPNTRVTSVHLEEREELILDKNELNIPKDYDLEDTSIGDDVRMISFTSGADPNGNGFRLNGKITKSMTLRPNGVQYARLLRERNLRSHDRAQTVAASDDRAILDINSDRSKALIDFRAPIAAEMRKKAREADLANKFIAKFATSKESEEHMNALRDKVMLAFENTERLKQADVQAFCHDVPGYTSQRVKDVLEQYCKYYQKGTYKHFWELKPEYRDSLAPPEEEP